jgi:hypothetical protein
VHIFTTGALPRRMAPPQKHCFSKFPKLYDKNSYKFMFGDDTTQKTVSHTEKIFSNTVFILFSFIIIQEASYTSCLEAIKGLLKMCLR